MADPVAWPFATGGDYTEQYDWLTDMLAAPTGGTQHRRLRQSPRTSLGFSALESGGNRRWMDVLLRANSAGVWWVPVSIDARPLDHGVLAGENALALTVAGARFVVGGHALIVGADPRRFEVCEVAAVEADSLTLTAGLSFAWPSGTQVVPACRGRLSDMPVVGRYTADDSGLVTTQFRLNDSLDTAPAMPGVPYRDFPVFDFIVPAWTSDPAWVPERMLATVDYEVALPVVADTAGVALGKTTMQYAPDTLAAITTFRAALFALAGRWSPTWVPSWANDLRVVANVSAGATTLDVEGPLLSTAAGAIQPSRRDIRIEMHGGTVYYRRITAVAAPGAKVDRLTLNAAFPASFAAAQVKMVSFLSLCVQDADTNLLRFSGPDVAQCEMVWRELDHEL